MESIKPELLYFLEVARAGSFTEAARRLGCGQPLLSKSIQKLERELKLKLLTRTSQGVTPTRAGEHLVQKIQPWIARWGEIESELREQRQEIAGSYTLGCHVSVGSDVLPRFLPHLLRTYPDLDFKISHRSSKEVTEDVLAFRLDFGIVIEPFPYPDLVIAPLGTRRVKVWAAKNSTPENDLRSERCVLFLNPELIRGAKMLEKTVAAGAPIRRVVPANSYEVITELVVSGAGIGILPEQVATKREGLRAVEFEGATLEYSLALVYRKDFQNTIASQTIVQAIKKSLKG